MLVSGSPCPPPLLHRVVRRPSVRQHRGRAVVVVHDRQDLRGVAGRHLREDGAGGGGLQFLQVDRMKLHVEYLMIVYIVHYICSYDHVYYILSDL